MLAVKPATLKQQMKNSKQKCQVTTRAIFYNAVFAPRVSDLRQTKKLATKVFESKIHKVGVSSL